MTIIKIYINFKSKDEKVFLKCAKIRSIEMDHKQAKRLWKRVIHVHAKSFFSIYN